MLRGKDAMWVEDSGTHLTIVAMLADGAQLKRRDRIVFRRHTTLRRDQEHFRAAVKVLRDSKKSFPAMARRAKLKGHRDGFDICVEKGVLRATVPVSPEITKGWRRARLGDTVYQLTHFALPNYRSLGNKDEPDRMVLVEICVSRWTPEGATQVPAWVMNER